MQTDSRQQVPGDEIAHCLEVAREVVARMRKNALQYFRTGVAAEIKSDDSPVTRADREGELIFRETIQKAFPAHGILGEEHESVRPEAEFRWVVDPIDGTQSFMHGIPTFGTMVALEFRGLPIVGIIDHPALGEEYYAAYGAGTFCSGRAIRIKDSAPPPKGWINTQEIICFTSRKAFSENKTEHFWDEFAKSVPLFRVYYDCFGLSRAVAGQAGVMIEINCPRWDMAPCRILAEEAGGTCLELPTWTDPKGLPRYSQIFGKPSMVKAVHEFFDSRMAVGPL